MIRLKQVFSYYYLKTMNCPRHDVKTLLLFSLLFCHLKLVCKMLERC